MYFLLIVIEDDCMKGRGESSCAATSHQMDGLPEAELSPTPNPTKIATLIAQSPPRPPARPNGVPLFCNLASIPSPQSRMLATPVPYLPAKRKPARVPGSIYQAEVKPARRDRNVTLVRGDREAIDKLDKNKCDRPVENQVRESPRPQAFSEKPCILQASSSSVAFKLWNFFKRRKM